MNKILIVGHPQSGFQEVERLLRACGMSQALPSRREGFAPDQISETLCKAHNTPALHRLGNDREVQQVDVAPVWQSLAMDLMLGNIDQPLWGWADPKAVYLLDYWLTLDPSLHFILVYDRPHSVLTRMGLQEAASLTREALKQRLDAWSAYNAAVLGFHLRHPERCLLVHSEQVVRSADASLQHVQARIDAPWKDRLPNTGISATQLIPTDVEDAKPSTQSLLLDGEIPFEASALSTVVASTLLKDQPGSQALYEELQASANLPLEADLAQGEDPALAMEAWLSFVAVQEKVHSQHHLARQLQVGRDQAERLAQDRERLIEEERRLRASERQEMTQQLTALQQARALIEIAQTKASQENDSLLSQLHEVQEELERQQVSKQEQSVLVEDLERQLLSERDLARQLQIGRDEAERLAKERDRLVEEERQLRVSERQEMTQQLAELQQARALVEIAQTKTSQENDALLSQLHEVQEELERQYLAAQEQTRHLKTLTEEEQLARQRVAEMEELQEKAKAATQAAQEKALQQIGTLTTEIAALKAKAESVNPVPRLAEENELLLSQLHQVQEELERYLIENQWLKKRETQSQQPTKPSRPAVYGAADRVKQQLSYRLGATLIDNSRSVGGWLSMPWALRRVVAQYRRDLPQHQAKGLPPIHTYADAYEADRVRNHLSYRLGEAFLKNARSPVGWLRMPFALNSAVKTYRQQQSR